MISTDLKTMENVRPWLRGGNARKMRINQGKVMQLIRANISTPIFG